ncbi:MAG: FAD:protein FMN transferase [Zavarzinella sp.]
MNLRHFTIICGLLFAAPLQGGEIQRFRYESPQMGTTFSITLYAETEQLAERAVTAAFERVAHLNTLMSDYDPKSELMQLCSKNKTTLAGPQKVSAELFYVLQKCTALSQLSEGAFDASIGPLSRIWRTARKEKKLPPAETIQTALTRMGYRNVKLNPKDRTVELLVPGMQLDLGGIAKGYAADEAIATLKKFNISIALVAASGDIATMGIPPDSKGWKIDIAPPVGSTDKRTVLLKEMAVSTSGDSFQFLEIDGKRYSHLIDPRTGYGIEGRRSVTVIAPRGIDADSYTKMASIWAPEKAIAAIEKIPGMECSISLMVGDKETTVQTKGFANFLAK